MIEKFISSLGIRDAEQKRYRTDLTEFTKLLSEHNHTFPTNNDFEEFRTRSQVNYSIQYFNNKSQHQTCAKIF